jgi:hypothetical protein
MITAIAVTPFKVFGDGAILVSDPMTDDLTNILSRVAPLGEPPRRLRCTRMELSQARNCFPSD